MKPLNKYKQGIVDKAFLRALRAKALMKQRNRCVYCKEPLNAVTVTADHIHPRSRGGNDHEDNILAACSLCNIAKGSKRITAFKKLVKDPPLGAPTYIYLAAMRRRLNKRVELAEKRILRSVGAA